jgi:hypothetical protein
MTDTQLTNQRFVLRSRPQALPDRANFALQSGPVNAPGCGQVLVEILMAALSPWQNQRLKDFTNYTQPFALGELIDCDVLGRVIASRDDAFAVGQQVTGRLGWQTYAVANAQQLLAADDEFSAEQWLSVLSSPGLTAYAAMDLFARPMPGQTMVITSAAGAVGSYAVQLGKLAGMHVVGIAGSPDKCAMVTNKLGADACINYAQPGFGERLNEACPDGVNLLFDTVGGDVADTVFDNLAKFARVLIVGRTVSNNSASPADDPVNMRQLWAREASVQCFSRYSYPERWEFARTRMQTLCRRNALISINHIVDGFEHTPLALREMLDGQHTGKTLVRYAT